MWNDRDSQSLSKVLFHGGFACEIFLACLRSPQHHNCLGTCQCGFVTGSLDIECSFVDYPPNQKVCAQKTSFEEGLYSKVFSHRNEICEITKSKRR